MATEREMRLHRCCFIDTFTVIYGGVGDLICPYFGLLVGNVFLCPSVGILDI